MDLEMEFCKILAENTVKIPHDPSEYSTMVTANVTKDFQKYTEMSNQAIDSLHDIARMMSSEGQLGGCFQAYKRTRKEFLDACFESLSIPSQRLSKNSVEMMRREEVEAKISDCTTAAKVCVEVLFPNEKSLCHKIFQGLGSASNNTTTVPDDAFTKTIGDYAIQLFDIFEALSCAPPSLLVILALHEALSDLLPQVNNLFQSKSFQQPIGILEKLTESAKEVLLKLPTQVKGSNLSQMHPEAPDLPRYLMRSFMIPVVRDYKKTVSQLIVWKPTRDVYQLSHDPYDLATKIDLGFVEVKGQTTPLSLHLMWIIVNLAYNLKSTSKDLYKDSKDACLGYKFTMRNYSYLVEKIEECPQLRETIGEEFLCKLRARFHRAVGDYLRSISSNILKFMDAKYFGITSQRRLRENLEKFNASLDDVHRTLATIVVSDTLVRERYQKSVLEKLVAVYKSFHGQLESHKVQPKYSPEDVATKIKSFFRHAPNDNPKW